MGLFGPSKQVLKLATLTADMRKDITNLEKQIEAKNAADEKLKESANFEMDALKKKVEKCTGILQAHVKAVMPRLDGYDSNLAELQERIKKLEETADVAKTKKGKRGPIDLTDIVEEHDTKLDEILKKVENDILPKFEPMEDMRVAMDSEIKKIGSDLGGMISDVNDCVAAADGAKAVQREFAGLKDHLTQKFHDLREDTLSLRYDYDLMLHTNTRQVNWNISDARQKITEMFMRSCSVWGPAFTVATFPVMYLQLRVCSDSGGSPGSQAAVRQISNMGAHMPTQGNVVVTVWTQPGVEAVFRISIGPVTKKFRAIFERDENNPDQEVVGCTVSNFGPLDAAWDRLNDTILVGLEIMEADLSGTVELEVKQPRVLTDFPAINDGKTSVMQFKRHIISDAQMLEQVERKLQNLKQRWVRKVEWQVRQILALVDKSKTNDVIESPPFSAAGISELKFVFYPRGIDPQQPNWCGLYLRCSEENVSIKFQLAVGKAVKTFEHFFSTKGEVYGKTRFCVLETQIENRADPELSLLNISVEVLEVSHRKRDSENVLLFHRDDTYAKEEYRVLTLPPRAPCNNKL